MDSITLFIGKLDEWEDAQDQLPGRAGAHHVQDVRLATARRPDDRRVNTPQDRQRRRYLKVVRVFPKHG